MHRARNITSNGSGNSWHTPKEINKLLPPGFGIDIVLGEGDEEIVVLFFFLNLTFGPNGQISVNPRQNPFVISSIRNYIRELAKDPGIIGIIPFNNADIYDRNAAIAERNYYKQQGMNPNQIVLQANAPD